MVTIPSLNKCISAFGDENGHKVYAALKCKDTNSLCEEYNIVVIDDDHSSLNEARLAACDQILGTHGVEDIGYHNQFDYGFSYCNTGDTYATTIGYDSKNQRFLITSYGDFVENSEDANDWQEEEDPNDEEESSLEDINNCKYSEEDAEPHPLLLVKDRDGKLLVHPVNDLQYLLHAAPDYPMTCYEYDKKEKVTMVYLSKKDIVFVGTLDPADWNP